MTANISHANLIGVIIKDDWKIVEQLPRPGELGAEDLTGSFFSIGYIASNGKKEAFVKIIDIQSALHAAPGSTLMDRLKVVTDSHSFECAILDICHKAKLDRVVQIIGQGEIPAPPGAVFPFPIPYIMFERADGDVRQIITRANKIDDALRFKVLHEVAVGIQQLHGQQIAHQDLKPSNVLLFQKDGEGAKLGDVGRSSHKAIDAHHNTEVIAGARIYAPPEQAYNITPPRWEDRREGCDLYHLGTLATFLFAGVTPTEHYIVDLPHNVRPRLWRGSGNCDYQTALPALMASFTVFVKEIRQDMPDWAADELSMLVFNACNPDFTKRGDPDARKRAGSPIGIREFVSRFDRLAKLALVNTRK
jgi:serine/threonine protein kinase